MSHETTKVRIRIMAPHTDEEFQAELELAPEAVEAIILRAAGEYDARLWPAVRMHLDATIEEAVLQWAQKAHAAAVDRLRGERELRFAAMRAAMHGDFE